MKLLTLLTLLTLITLAVVSPVAAQSETWCQLFDFTKGQQGWNVSYTGEYGRFTNNRGFSAYQYGSLDYAAGRSIRIHRDFSGELTEFSLFSAYANYDYARLDFNSEISGAGYREFGVVPVEGDPMVITLSPTTVTSRLGAEILTGTFLGTDTALTAVITGIRLRGNGTNPFTPPSSCDVELSMPIDDMFNTLNGADDSIQGIGRDLTAPDGTPLLPATNGTQVFAYAKWLLDPTATDEYAGPFAPIIQHVGIGVTMMMAILAIYVIVWASIYVVRWVIWLFSWFLKLLDIIMQMIQAGVSVILQGASAVLRFVTG